MAVNMEPLEFIKTGEDGTSFVLNMEAVDMLQKVKKTLVSKVSLLPSYIPAPTPTQFGAELVLTSISTPIHLPNHPQEK